MGTGVSPSTAFLKDNSAFKLEDDGGVTVDPYLRIKGHENIYAIGDIAHYEQYPEKNVRRVEHWNVAGNMGRDVGYNIAKGVGAGGEGLVYQKVPIFWSSVGKGQP
jgi:NADH dehydrogenase FAD-containing subunit